MSLEVRSFVMTMIRNYLNILKVMVFSVMSLLLAVISSVYLFEATNVLSFRIVTVFLALIFVSNLGSKFLIAYFGG